MDKVLYNVLFVVILLKYAMYIFQVSCCVIEPGQIVIRLELKGPDNSLRLRQVKVLGEIDGSSLVVSTHQSPLIMQQKNCEAETLKVFRLLTSQV